MTDTNRDATETIKALQEKLASATDLDDFLPEAFKYFTENMPLVWLASPYGDHDPETHAANVSYARAALQDIINRGEIPFTTHLKYTRNGLLDDDTIARHTLGISACLVEGMLTTKTAVYVDRGFSSGMLEGIQEALKVGRPVVLRTLNGSANMGMLKQDLVDMLQELPVEVVEHNVEVDA